MTLGVLLVLYLLLMGVWAIFSALIIGHLFRYGGVTPKTIVPIALYLGTCAVIGIISFVFIGGIDWLAPLSFLSFY